MTYKDVQKKLKELSYQAYLRKVNNNIEFLTCGIADEETNLKAGSTFNIFIEENKIKVELLNGQLPVQRVFASISELASFVTKKFK